MGVYSKIKSKVVWSLKVDLHNIAGAQKYRQQQTLLSCSFLLFGLTLYPQPDLSTSMTASNYEGHLNTQKLRHLKFCETGLKQNTVMLTESLGPSAFLHPVLFLYCIGCSQDLKNFYWEKPHKNYCCSYNCSTKFQEVIIKLSDMQQVSVCLFLNIPTSFLCISPFHIILNEQMN